MNYKSEIVKIIINTSGSYSPYQIFRDWCECVAIAIQNSSVLFHDEIWKEREKRYMDTISKYSEEDRMSFIRMTGYLIMAFDNEIGDLLGEIYMESGAGNSRAGQFFTPFHISEMIAKMNKDQYINENVVSMMEPSCGAGGMIIAVAKVLREAGAYKRIKVVAQDLDWLAVYMTYIQISLLGVDGIVVQGDTLCEPFDYSYDKRRILRTPRNTGALIF